MHVERLGDDPLRLYLIFFPHIENLDRNNAVELTAAKKSRDVAISIDGEKRLAVYRHLGVQLEAIVIPSLLANLPLYGRSWKPAGATHNLAFSIMVVNSLITFTETTAFMSLAENLASSTPDELPESSMVPDLTDEAALMFMLQTTSDILSTNLELYDTDCEIPLD